MRFKGLDLNLLVALNTMLEERSVSRAAERLNLSQPAVSAALARLREFFDDELLVPLGRQMMPTSFAESLRPVIVDLLTNAERLIATSSSFDPATSQRCFCIGASDFISIVLLPPLLRRLEREAPSLRIDVIPTGHSLHQQFERGKVDIVIEPEQYTHRTTRPSLCSESNMSCSAGMKTPSSPKTLPLKLSMHAAISP